MADIDVSKVPANVTITNESETDSKSIQMFGTNLWATIDPKSTLKLKVDSSKELLYFKQLSVEDIKIEDEAI